MKAAEHDKSPTQKDTNTTQAWVREPDEAEKKKQAAQSQTGREEAQVLEEPGYGHGV